MDAPDPASAEPDAVHEITQETIPSDLSPQAWLDKGLSTFSVQNLNRSTQFVRDTNLPCGLTQIDSTGRQRTVYLVPTDWDMEPRERKSILRKGRRGGKKRIDLMARPKKLRATRSRDISGSNNFSRAIASHIVQQACIVISERYESVGDSCSDDHATSGRKSFGVYLYSSAIALASLRHFLPWLYKREMDNLKQLITYDLESRLSQSTTLQGQDFVHDVEMLIWAAYHDKCKYFDEDDRVDIKKRLRYYRNRTKAHFLTWEVKHSMKEYRFKDIELSVDRRNRLGSLVRGMKDLSTTDTGRTENVQSVCNAIWDEIAGDFDPNHVHGLEFFFSHLAQFLTNLSSSKT